MKLFNIFKRKPKKHECMFNMDDIFNYSITAKCVDCGKEHSMGDPELDRRIKESNERMEKLFGKYSPSKTTF